MKNRTRSRRLFGLLRIRNEYDGISIEVSTMLKPIQRVVDAIIFECRLRNINVEKKHIDISGLNESTHEWATVCRILKDPFKDASIPNHQPSYDSFDSDASREQPNDVQSNVEPESVPSKNDQTVTVKTNVEEMDVSTSRSNEDDPHSRISPIENTERLDDHSNVTPPNEDVVVDNGPSTQEIEKSRPHSRSRSRPPSRPGSKRSPTPVTSAFVPISSSLLMQTAQSVENITSIVQAVMNQKAPTVPVASSRQIGIDGEADVENRLRKLFPEMEIHNTASQPHSCDIHLIDNRRSILFAVEVKLKRTVNGEDVSKFERDLEELKAKQADIKVVGLFISLSCGIPRYGELYIASDRCYLANQYTNDECLSMAVRMYQSIEKAVNADRKSSVQYEIPQNVFRLLSEMKSQYAVLHSTTEVCYRQIEFNRQSTNAMHDLIAKVEVQRHFIEYVSKEFSEIGDQTETAVVNIEEQKLKDYVQSHGRSRIKKAEIKSLFPTLREVHAMRLDEIWERYH